MSALQEISGLAGSGTREWVARNFWEWYDQNLDDRISIKVWKLPVSIRIRQLRPVFERLFGPRPFPT